MLDCLCIIDNVDQMYSFTLFIILFREGQYGSLSQCPDLHVAVVRVFRETEASSIIHTAATANKS